MKHPELKILLGPELWQDDIVAGLVALGHTVTALPKEFDVAISYDAWRVPPSTSQAEVMKYIGTVLKQVRLTKHVANPTTEEGTVKVHKPTRKRSAKASAKTKTDATDSGIPTREATQEPASTTGE